MSERRDPNEILKDLESIILPALPAPEYGVCLCCGEHGHVHSDVFIDDVFYKRICVPCEDTIKGSL